MKGMEDAGDANYVILHGFTKRELFAAMAMQALTTDKNGSASITALALEHGFTGYQGTAKIAVAHADALIAELEKT